MTLTDLAALARSTQPGAAATDERTTGVPPPRRRWKTRILLPGAILLATAGLLGFAAGETLRPATPVRVVAVLVKTDVEAQPAGTVIVQAPGWVEADPFPTGVSALADGVVAQVLVLEGERVEVGQVVATLIDEDARIALSQAEALLVERKAELAAARAAHDEAQRNWDHPIELTRRLESTQAQLAETRAELERWQSEVAREEALAVYLKAEYERLVPLREGGQASDIELVQARQAYEAQKAEVEATRRRKPILEARIRALTAEVQAAREDQRLRIADTRALAAAAAGVQRAEAAVASARAQRDEAALRLERMQVRSPAAGVVMARLVEPGSKLMRDTDDPRSAQVVRLYDPQRLQVRVDIPLADAAKVGAGQPAQVIADVLPERIFRGRVTRTVHEADVQKNTLQVKVAIEDPSPELRPEMLARARFLARPDPNAAEATGPAAELLFVPESAVILRDGRSVVWLADGVDNVARLRPVTVGRAEVDDWIAVAEGLRPGDRVIVAAPPDLKDGQRIRLVED